MKSVLLLKTALKQQILRKPLKLNTKMHLSYANINFLQI